MSYQNAKLMNLEDGQKLLEAIDQHKAEKDGAYEDLASGNALYLLSDRGDTDVAPYVFRKTGGSKNGYGREFLRKIVGGTVAWNQLATSNSEVFPANVNRSSGIALFTGIVGHKYIFAVTQENSITSNTRNLVVIRWNNGAQIDYEANSMENSNLTKGTRFVMFSCPEGGPASFAAWVHTPDADVTYDKPMIFDLTQMFGSTIADAIYTMEQATVGSGVAWFRSLFPKDYYAYNAGSLQSVQAKEHRLTGKNIFDKNITFEKNKYIEPSDGSYVYSEGKRAYDFIPVVGGQTFTANKAKYNNITFFSSWTFWDADKNFVSGALNGSNTFIAPSNAAYLRLSTTQNYTDDVYESFLADYIIAYGSSVPTYVPYEEHTYPLDSSLILRGIPKWDSTNGLYYDGDEYKPDGSVKRKYGIVDLGSLTWSYVDVSSLRYFYTSISGMKSPLQALMANYSKTDGLPPQDKTYGTNWAYIGTDKFVIRNDTYLSYSVADFKSAMSGVYLVYELATPTTEQADPYRELQISAHGGTEEFVDAGVTATTPTRDVSIPVGTETFYPIDVVAYIEELTNPDHDMVADALIPSGKYFMVGNSLYKSTSQIQAGDTIIPGSNCTAKTLAEALNELNT